MRQRIHFKIKREREIEGERDKKEGKISEY